MITEIPEELINEMLKKMDTSILEASPCPHCGKINDAATNITTPGLKPSTGDVGLCVACGEWTVYDENMQLAVPSDDLLIEIGLSSEARQAREAWTMVMTHRNYIPVEEAVEEIDNWIAKSSGYHWNCTRDQLVEVIRYAAVDGNITESRLQKIFMRVESSKLGTMHGRGNRGINEILNSCRKRFRQYK